MSYSKSQPRVQFQLFDFNNYQTMLTVRKDVVEALYEMFGDAHEWIQDKYDEIVNHYKLVGIVVSRRAIGDAVRRAAWKEVT